MMDCDFEWFGLQGCTLWTDLWHCTVRISQVLMRIHQMDSLVRRASKFNSKLGWEPSWSWLTQYDENQTQAEHFSGFGAAQAQWSNIIWVFSWNETWSSIEFALVLVKLRPGSGQVKSTKQNHNWIRCRRNGPPKYIELKEATSFLTSWSVTAKVFCHIAMSLLCFQFLRNTYTIQFNRCFGLSRIVASL